MWIVDCSQCISSLSSTIRISLEEWLLVLFLITAVIHQLTKQQFLKINWSSLALCENSQSQLMQNGSFHPYWDSMASHRWPSVIQGILTDGPSMWDAIESQYGWKLPFCMSWLWLFWKPLKTLEKNPLENPIFLRLHNTNGSSSL